MKAVISTTYDDLYQFFLPITTFLWNKLGVGVIVFRPDIVETNDKLRLIGSVMNGKMDYEAYMFRAPENKQATYAQVSRLYAASLNHLPEDEVLITSDIDMGVFQLPPHDEGFTIFGSDLVPPRQIPMCYISANVGEWRKVFEINGRTVQQCLDDLLGNIECENMRGNYWGKDQEEAYNKITQTMGWLHYECRAKGDTQFATKRYDRDDSFLLERISPDTIDFHMPRPGYEDKAFEIILTVLKYHYPNDDFQWLIDYKNQYQNLL